MKFAIIAANCKAGSDSVVHCWNFLDAEAPSSTVSLGCFNSASPALLTIDFPFPECYKPQDAHANTLLLPFDQLLGSRPDQNGQARIIAG
jgi:hypothetical protein